MSIENPASPGGESLPGARVLGPRGGGILGAPNTVRDRFMVGAGDSGGGFSMLEHLMPPRALAAPLHRHTLEDEYGYVLEGRVGALLGDEEVFGEVGDLIFKPRSQWHTFWNAGDTPARILEIIAPGGFEEAFREMRARGRSRPGDDGGDRRPLRRRGGFRWRHADHRAPRTGFLSVAKPTKRADARPMP